MYREIPQRITHTYKAEANFAAVLFVMLRRDWFHELAWVGAAESAINVSKVHPDFAALILNVPRLLTLDFTSLRLQRVGYESQTHISPNRIDLLTACAVHYNLDFGLVVRYLGGEYTAKWRDTHAILAHLRPVADPSDLAHVERILTIGCPAHFNWEEPDSNKELFLRRAATAPLTKHMAAVNKALNKEERNSHIIPFPSYLVRASTTAHHVPQCIIQKEGKNDRLVWDGSTKLTPHELVMNEVTPTDDEPDITFGFIYVAFLVWIWNLRISFPDEDIILAFIDISSCFRWPRIFPCLAGAFGFIIGSIFYAANAMVFGSTASASSWEPFRRSIAALAESYGQTQDIVDVHSDMLSTINLLHPEVDEDIPITPASSCTKNQGIFTHGPSRKTPHFIYVDDDLMADTPPRMPFTIASVLHAVYNVMGWPKLCVRPSPIALDKWKLLRLRTRQILLGLVFDTRKMTVGITDEFRQDTLALLRSSWHACRRSFTVHDIEVLIGKLGRIGQAFRPIYHLMPHLYASVAYALRENSFLLASSSKEFCLLIRKAKQAPTTKEDVREVRFAVRQSAKLTHRCKATYIIPPSLKEELEYITALLADESVSLSVPIGHIVPRDPTFTAAADSCKSAGGGWSTDLKFWWHLSYPDEVVARARLPNNKSGTYISINVLEMVCVIINMVAAICACSVDDTDVSSNPVLLNFCDNTAACSWVNHKCKSSLIGRRLARLFVGLVLGTPIGIQTEWLPSHENIIADDISRLKKLSTSSPIESFFDYASLLTTYSQLSICHKFQPSHFLLGMIWDVLLHKKSPDPLILRQTAPSALGHFIS